MSTDPFVKGVVPMTHGAQRRFLQRRSPGSSIPPTSAPLTSLSRFKLLTYGSKK